MINGDYSEATRCDMFANHSIKRSFICSAPHCNSSMINSFSDYVLSLKTLKPFNQIVDYHLPFLTSLLC